MLPPTRPRIPLSLSPSACSRGTTSVTSAHRPGPPPRFCHNPASAMSVASAKESDSPAEGISPIRGHRLASGSYLRRKKVSYSSTTPVRASSQ